MTDIPVIPVLSSNPTPTELKRAIDVLRIYFAALQKDGGAVSKNDVVTAGIAALSSEGALTPPTYQIPSAPTALVVTGGFNTIHLSWAGSFFASYTEVYRAEVDDLGQAVLIGTTQSGMYTDTPPDSRLSATYFYWVRFINKDGAPGPYNGLAGTSGHTADEPEYAYELLVDSKWKPAANRALDFLGYPSRPNGFAYKATVAGTSGGTEPTWPTTIGDTVVDGTITWRCEAAVPTTLPFEIGYVNGVVQTVIKSLLIGDATISNAMIKELNGDKINSNSIITIGNTVDGDYCQIDNGDIAFYKKFPSGRYLYKSLRRVESGFADNGSLVTLPGYWKTQPRVLVTPQSIQSYNSSYPNQSQALTAVSNPAYEDPVGSGIWKFVPQINLAIASGYYGGDLSALIANPFGLSTTTKTIDTTTINTPANTVSVTANVDISSSIVVDNGYSMAYITLCLVVDGVATAITQWSWWSAHMMMPPQTVQITGPSSASVTVNVAPGIHSVGLRAVGWLVPNSYSFDVNFTASGTISSLVGSSSILATGTVNYLAVGD